MGKSAAVELRRELPAEDDADGPTSVNDTGNISTSTEPDPIAHIADADIDRVWAKQRQERSAPISKLAAFRGHKRIEKTRPARTFGIVLKYGVSPTALAVHQGVTLRSACPLSWLRTLWAVARQRPPTLDRPKVRSTVPSFEAASGGTFIGQCAKAPIAALESLALHKPDAMMERQTTNARPEFFIADPPPLDVVRCRARLSREYSLTRRRWNPRAPVYMDNGSKALVGFIRHSLTAYDRLRQGRTQAECDALRQQVNQSILATYPELEHVA
jgi:hypothetical protein